MTKSVGDLDHRRLNDRRVRIVVRVVIIVRHGRGYRGFGSGGRQERATI